MNKKSKLSEAQIKARNKWDSENSYKMTVTFYKNKFPKEMFEQAKEEIKKMGISQNEFFVSKLKELLKEKGDD